MGWMTGEKQMALTALHSLIRPFQALESMIKEEFCFHLLLPQDSQKRNDGRCRRREIGTEGR